MTDAQYPDGVTVDSTGTVHVDVVGVLRGWGIEPTVENIERATLYLLEASRELGVDAEAVDG